MLILGLGSNLSSSFGDRFKNINLAISYLEESGIKVIKKSSFYETPSYPDIQNPKFINMVVHVETIMPPLELMSTLILVEEKLERKRFRKKSSVQFTSICVHKGFQEFYALCTKFYSEFKGG